MRKNREEWIKELKEQFDLNFFRTNKVLIGTWWLEYQKEWDLWEQGQWIERGMGTEDGFQDFWNEMRFPHYVNNTVDQIVGIINPNMEAFMLWQTIESMEDDDQDYEKFRYWYHRRMMEWRVSKTPIHQVYWWGDEDYSETCYI